MAADTNKEHGKIHIEGIIFDYGNVLCHPQQPTDVEAMAKACGIPASRLQPLYWKYRLTYDRGDFTGESYWQTIADNENLSLSREQIAQLVELDAAGWARENVDTVRWVEQLHDAGYALALLSNMPKELSLALRARGSWSRFFPHCIFSCDTRCNKPAPEIYEACLNALQMPPQQVLFIDDIPENVEAASRLGIHSLVFDTAERTQARAAEKFDVPVSLGASSSLR